LLTLREVQARFVNKQTSDLHNSDKELAEFGSSGNGGVLVGLLTLLMTDLNTAVETKGFNYGPFGSNLPAAVNSRQLTDQMLLCPTPCFLLQTSSLSL
jgi:hypothetical protein